MAGLDSIIGLCLKEESADPVSILEDMMNGYVYILVVRIMKVMMYFFMVVPLCVVAGRAPAVAFPPA